MAIPFMKKTYITKKISNLWNQCIYFPENNQVLVIIAPGLPLLFYIFNI